MYFELVIGSLQETVLTLRIRTFYLIYIKMEISAVVRITGYLEENHCPLLRLQFCFSFLMFHFQPAVLTIAL